jgi:hypothetical protein
VIRRHFRALAKACGYQKILFVSAAKRDLTCGGALLFANLTRNPEDVD